METEVNQETKSSDIKPGLHSSNSKMESRGG